MADNTTTVQDTTDTTGAADVQPGGTVLTTPQGDDAQSTAAAAENATAASDGEDKGNDSKDGEGQAKDDQPAGPPEKYEFKAPEGVQLDETALTEFEPVARELGLTQQQADKLVALQASLVQRQQEAYLQQRETWMTAVKGDKEIGGQSFTPSVQAAQKALTTFGTPELRTALETSGLGNHPEVVRVFARIGKAMADDSFVAGNAPGTEKSPAEMLYGSK